MSDPKRGEVWLGDLGWRRKFVHCSLGRFDRPGLAVPCSKRVVQAESHDELPLAIVALPLFSTPLRFLQAQVVRMT
jgi:hypothetical protein